MEPFLTTQTERDPMEMALSIEIVMDIVLSNLKVTDLLNCRKVSKFWNKAASSVLRKRSTMMNRIYNEEDLMKLQECIKLNPDFPFAGLKLQEPQRFHAGDAKKFFQNYGERFTWLRLETCWTARLAELAQFMILLPRLSILEVGRPQRLVRDPRSFELLDSDARQEDGVVLKLPSVRIIRFLSSDAVDKYILQKIVMAASPSAQIECLDARPETLTTLRSCGKEVLAKLTKLSLRVYSRFCFGGTFRGRPGDKFPALKELHLHFLEGLAGSRNVGRGCSSGLFVVPSVTVLDLKGCVNEDGIEQLAQSFPNIIDVRLDYGSYENPVQIWGVGKFKCLEKLRIRNVIVRPPTKNCLTMDSFLTGIPVEICKYLHDQMQLGFSDSPPREVSQNNPSILQLKNLKELVVCMLPQHMIDQGGPPFISMVSVRYALEMMPNLRAKFVYPHRPYLQEQDNAVLEDAFKYDWTYWTSGQPFIKVEPFFY